MTAHVVAAWYVCHDAKTNGHVELSVDLDVPPTRADAERLLLPLAIAEVERETGDPYEVALTTVLLDGTPYPD